MDDSDLLDIRPNNCLFWWVKETLFTLVIKFMFVKACNENDLIN